MSRLSLLHPLLCLPYCSFSYSIPTNRNAKGNIILLKLVTSILILTIFALTLVPTRHSMTKALTILLIAMSPPTSTSTLIHPLLHIISPSLRHLLIHMGLKAVRVPRLHPLHRLLSLLLVFSIVAAVLAVALARAVLLALKTLAVQLQTPALLAVARYQTRDARRRRTDRFRGALPR